MDFRATLTFVNQLTALPLVFCLESAAVYTVVPKKGWTLPIHTKPLFVEYLIALLLYCNSVITWYCHKLLWSGGLLTILKSS